MVYAGGEEFVIADIPGLIAGAHEGAGLGDRFLGHIERCGVLLHLIDSTAEDLSEAYRTVRRELEAYGQGLAEKPEIVALNKVDALDPETLETRTRELSAIAGAVVSPISGVSGAGMEALLQRLLQAVLAARAARKAERAADPEDLEAEEGWRP